MHIPDTNGKRLKDTLQFVCYLVCTSNIKIVESREEKFVWCKQFWRHSKKKLLYYNELALVNVGNIFKEYNYF